jgi:PIN domain nuclease of toxin-antitoxin system
MTHRLKICQTAFLHGGWMTIPPFFMKAKEAIADGGNMVLVSAATIWEIRIKHSLGKLEIPVNFRKVLE